MKEAIELLKKYREKRRFGTRGLPLAKKMWRDGYNKALDDVLTYFEMYDISKREQSRQGNSRTTTIKKYGDPGNSLTLVVD